LHAQSPSNYAEAKAAYDNGEFGWVQMGPDHTGTR
jgi:hypothetical protein